MNGYNFTYNEDSKGQGFRSALDKLRGDKVFRSKIEREVGQGGGGEWSGALRTLRSQERPGEFIKGKVKLAGLREEEELEDIQDLISKKTSPAYQGMRKASREKEAELRQQQFESGTSDEEFEEAKNEYRLAGGSATGIGLKDFLGKRKGLISSKFQTGPFNLGQNQQSGGILGGSMNRMFA